MARSVRRVLLAGLLMAVAAPLLAAERLTQFEIDQRLRH